MLHAVKNYPLGDTHRVAEVTTALVLVIAGVIVANRWDGRAARRGAKRLKRKERLKTTVRWWWHASAWS
jgi:hypothetical protein